MNGSFGITLNAKKIVIFPASPPEEQMMDFGDCEVVMETGGAGVKKTAISENGDDLETPHVTKKSSRTGEINNSDMTSSFMPEADDEDEDENDHMEY